MFLSFYQDKDKPKKYDGNPSQPHQFIRCYLAPHLHPTLPPHLLFIAPFSKVTEAQKLSEQQSFLIFWNFPKKKQT